MATDEQRQAERQALAEEERQMKERQAKGIKDVVFTEADRKLMERVIKLGAIAKQAARAKVALKVFTDEGSPRTLEERVGNEDMIFMALLNTRLTDREGER